MSLALCLVASSVVTAQSGWWCRAKPVQPCFKHHGRLSSQNGIALRLWLIGTRRIVNVDNRIDDLPRDVRPYLEMTSPEHSYIFGDFEICPLEPDTPGHSRLVCLAGAEKLVVQNLQGLRPPFRVRSTWPSEATTAASPDRP